MSLSSSHQSVIDTLTSALAKANPDDVLQFCANHFHQALELERSSNRPASGTNGKMADTAGPFDNRSPFGNKNVNSIDEEDEERDTFGAPDSKSKDKGSSSFGTFGAAAGGTAGGGLFGSWLGSTGNEPQDTSSQPMPNNYAGNRRTSVSAESMQPDADSGNWKPPKHAKTDAQLERLKGAVASNFLFSQLDEHSFNTVLGALSEKKVPAPNIKVITQGDEGDYFYVVEEGEYDVYIHESGALQPGADGMGKKVGSINPGGSFGELALMYNAPRAATIVSTSKGGVLWQLDRVTFRRILMTDAAEKRKMYEGFLEEVPLLSELKPYERSKVADALETVKFGPGQNIITEGEPGDAFYLLEEGEAQAFKHGINGSVKDYKRGDFFGELALLDDKPRQASVVSSTNVKVAKLGRDGFKRLLGPLESIMRREEYENPDNMDPLTTQKTVT
jgi:cAMP-dependent protein kinase regulator